MDYLLSRNNRANGTIANRYKDEIKHAKGSGGLNTHILRISSVSSSIILSKVLKETKKW